MNKFIIFGPMLHSFPKWDGAGPGTNGNKFNIFGPMLHSFQNGMVQALGQMGFDVS